MKRVLLTAFSPYGAWTSNASWLCVEALTRDLPVTPQLTTRRYPVDFQDVRARLARDLECDYDVALHLGQAPGSTRIRLEAVGLNLGGESADRTLPLEVDGPLAVMSNLPLSAWVAGLNAAKMPAELSHHAGTYLCNATLYWSLLTSERMKLRTRSVFVHLPLEVSQATEQGAGQPTMPAELTAAAIRWLLAQIDIMP